MPAPPPEQADALRSYLRGRSTPCPGCGFDLRDCPSPVCPECGDALELTLRHRRAPAAETAATVLLAAGAGACGVILAVSLIQTVFGGGPLVRPRLDFDDAHAFIALFAFPVFLALLIFWLRSHTERQTRGERLTMVVGSSLGLALFVLLLALTG